MKPTARTVALDVLSGDGPNAPYVDERLSAALECTPLSAVDRGLAMELVYGVTRRRGSLDYLLSPLLNRPPQNWLTDVLRLGAYQLVYLTQIPIHAAMHETVELAAYRAQSEAKGFVNGVLRNLTRRLTADLAQGPGRDCLPLLDGQYRRLARPLLPDPRARPSAYLSAAFSLPRWLADRWFERFGWDECLRLGFWFNAPPPLWLRSNPLRMERDKLCEALLAAGFQTTPGDHSQAIRLTEHAVIRSLPGYEQGWFSVQDAVQMEVATALAPAPGMTILDRCSAPGGKTAHLAELMANRGRIVACDIDREKLRTVRELTERLGVSIMETQLLTKVGAPPNGPFDAALVDVPCSNTGVLGRRPDLRWRLSPNDLTELVAIQKRLLFECCERVQPGGCVVYSTCSIEPEENQNVVRSMLEKTAEWTLEAERNHLPGQPSDGGYWARLRRNNRA